MPYRCCSTRFRPPHTLQRGGGVANMQGFDLLHKFVLCHSFSLKSHGRCLKSWTAQKNCHSAARNPFKVAKQIAIARMGHYTLYNPSQRPIIRLILTILRPKQQILVANAACWKALRVAPRNHFSWLDVAAVFCSHLLELNLERRSHRTFGTRFHLRLPSFPGVPGFLRLRWPLHR